ncbi:MAG: response regulator [Sphingomicrobium sp.]
MTRRSAFLIIAAAILPLILLFVLLVGFAAREQRQRVETEARAQAELIVAASDAAVARTIGALDVLANAEAIARGDMAAAYRRVRGAAELEPDWAGVTLIRTADEAIMFDTRLPFGARTGQQAVGVGNSLSFAPVIRAGAGCPCVALSRDAAGVGGPYRLTVLHSTRPFARLLPSIQGRYEVSALVTGEGRFVARSIKDAERVGRPGSKYLRAAVAGGAASGLYSGYTLEGFANYTAFARSRLTGWSAHLAMANRTIDAPRLRALGSLALAGLLSLAFAGILILFVLRQISEGRLAAERLQQTQKLEALGQLTGGIAHDFNNLLTPIVGALDLLSKRQDIDDRARRIAANGISSANRAAKLTGQLLAFSRQQKLTLKQVDLCALLEDIRPLLEQSAGDAERLLLHFAHDNCWAETDPLQLELALINLILNARDASPADSPIGVSVTPAKLRGKDAWRLLVADQGSGMPDAVKSRAFEPFFTTKQTGRGTGLGLAQVFAFARQSSSEVQIDSAPGAGTRVSLLLPVGVPPPREEAVPASAPPAPGGGLDILIVDDQPEVRETLTVTLEDDGHRVDSADSGAAALALMAKRSYALGVIDFAMPGMNGAELIAMARSLYPAMRFLIVTGYLDSEAVEAAAPGTAILAKPFDPDRLRLMVSELTGLSLPEA